MSEKICWTCRSKIDLWATRCPYCTTEINFNGLTKEQQQHNDQNMDCAIAAIILVLGGAALYKFWQWIFG